MTEVDCLSYKKECFGVEAREGGEKRCESLLEGIGCGAGEGVVGVDQKKGDGPEAGCVPGSRE